MKTTLERNVEYFQLKQYRRLRALGWHAHAALDAARTHADWFRAHDGDDVETPGNVRLLIEPDQSGYAVDDLAGDMFDRNAHPDISEKRMAREEQVFADRLDRDGVWCLVGEYWNGDEWVSVDCCGGFVGDDWRDSGYDTDIMRATLDAARDYMDSQNLVGAV